MSTADTAPEMLDRLRDNAQLWAQEFNKTAVKMGYGEMDEDWLIGWFANAIEHSHAVRLSALVASPSLEPFGTYIERNDGVCEFRRTGEPHTPATSGYTFWTLYAASLSRKEVQVTDAMEALIDKYAKGAYVGQISKPPISVYVEHMREFADKLLALAALRSLQSGEGE